MRLSSIILLVCMAAAFYTLCSLGFWQLDRLEWKEAMIARVEAGLEETPVDLDTIEAKLQVDTDIEYRPVSVTGTFDHTGEQHFYATYNGRAGYHVYTPLKEPNGRLVMVNRGFVPYTQKDASSRIQGQVSGQITFEGLARSAPSKKPNAFVFDNDLVKNVFHWKSLDQMLSRAYETPPGKPRPFFVDMKAADVPGGLPISGVTRVTFSNSHLSYALTWFGLAGTLLFVGIPFAWSRFRKA
ncbi:MAG: SURF1 family protein [Pseudomonadota bacterium]